ncbi:ABC transporter ATP-binding protein [Haliangium ochraceum]|uniref:ABC transporter related protein n=1 Tax=Haliangium ochraceum (strain DSM 14365 / JCM 11303 / SMP-2) TaxID=502025 RepID=D0LIR5_HALO1|nr:ABC transporter ATP-binding protein [Haliangium ochraceum]ACY12944.1 ABC transporter related protein [Haliangium ochraceum DSM 14365]
MTAIETHALSKRFGALAAVDQVEFEVRAGEIFGLMGHNGSGKTTLLRMLLGLLAPSGGRASVFGLDPQRDALAVRRRCGYLPAEYTLPPDMTPRSLLDYIAAMFGLPAEEARARAEQLIDSFDLGAAADRKLRGFSTGMLQKVGLAQALINEPELLLLDEPTSGLDPLGRHDLLERLRHASAERGTTVVFSSHILSDVEALCSRVAVLHHGRLIAYGALDELKREHKVADIDALYLALARREAA